MRVWCILYSATICLALGGCGANSMVVKGQLEDQTKKYANLQSQTQQLQTDVSSLNARNEQLQAQLAQTEQQSKLLKDNLSATREQLTSISAQLAKTQDAYNEEKNRVQAMKASFQKRGGVIIEPNRSIERGYLDLPEPVVSHWDNGALCISVPGHVLFERGQYRLRPAGVPLLESIAAKLATRYPDNLITVEGHVGPDSGLAYTREQNTQLSLNRATAVYHVLKDRSSLEARQLTISARGDEKPHAPQEGGDQMPHTRIVIRVEPQYAPGK